MVETIKTTFKLRRATAEEWQTKNPVLGDGEPGWILDEYVLKIGDGKTAWNNLPEIKDTKIIEEQLKTLPGFISTNGKWNEIFNSYTTNKIEINPNTKNYPTAAHIEGSNNTVSGASSHAEGDQNNAEAACSHAEGLGTMARGYASHTQNSRNEAYGYGSSANGYYTRAYGAGNFVIGMYNDVDDENKNLGTQHSWPSGRPEGARGTNAFTIGNGTSETKRSNAMTVDWDGNTYIQGQLQCDGDIVAPNITVINENLEKLNSNLEIIQTTASNANTQAQSAFNAATIAQTSADNAINIATGTETKVNTANTLANSANNTANQCMEILNEIGEGLPQVVGNDIMVLKTDKSGTMILQENTYYQILGSTEKKTLTFYNSDNSVGYTCTFQVLTINCGSITDNAKYDLPYENNIPVAYAYYIGNDTGWDALTGAETGCYGFKKASNDIYRAEVAYPAGSVIIIHTKNLNGLPPINNQ